jgi:hypothetical protein
VCVCAVERGCPDLAPRQQHGPPPLAAAGVCPARGCEPRGPAAGGTSAGGAGGVGGRGWRGRLGGLAVLQAFDEMELQGAGRDGSAASDCVCCGDAHSAAAAAAMLFERVLIQQKWERRALDSSQRR